MFGPESLKQRGNMQQVRLVDWDVSECQAPGADVGSALEESARDCWGMIFRQSTVARLIKDILRYPADVVMLQLRRHERCCQAA